jgi:outer membrane autotransporter protein
MSIVPTIGGYWSHRFGELSNASRISTNQGSSYEYVGAKPPLNVANIYASVMANLNENVALSAGYSAAFNSIERNHTGTVGLRVRW